MPTRKTKGPRWAVKKAQLEATMKVIAQARKSLDTSQRALAAAQKVLRKVTATIPGDIQQVDN